MSSPRPFYERIFLSADEMRLRAGWRVALQVALWLLLTFCFTLPLLPLALLFPDLLSTGPISMPVLLVSTVAGAMAVTASVFIARRFFDRRPFQSLGLAFSGDTLPDLLVGFLIPAAQMGLVFAIEWALGWVRWIGWAWEVAPPSQVVASLALGLLVFVLVGYQEELLSRGYHLQNLRDGSGLVWGVVLSSAIFSVMHLGNPGAGLASTLGLFLAGVFLAFGWIRTGSLWLSIGLHIGWNFFEGTFFGFAVSGLDLDTLMRHVVTGPDWATGGAFGPEAGLIMVPAYILGVALIMLYTRNRRQIAS